MNVIWVAPSPIARGAISSSALRACGSPSVDPWRVAEAEARQRAELDEQVAERPGDDADREALDADRSGQEQRRADDREVVDDRGERRGREPAAGVEDARRDRAERQEDRAQQHDPRQLDGLVESGRRRSPGVMTGTMTGARMNRPTAEDEPGR